VNASSHNTLRKHWYEVNGWLVGRVSCVFDQQEQNRAMGGSYSSDIIPSIHTHSIITTVHSTMCLFSHWKVQQLNLLPSGIQTRSFRLVYLRCYTNVRLVC
jgi:hypothetical protein